MAARDKKLPVIIDLEDDDSVALIPWEYIVDKMDKILGNYIIPDLAEINKDLNEINEQMEIWIEEQNS